MAALLFSPRPRQGFGAGPFFFQALSRTMVRLARKELDMRQLGSLLRSAPSRIGRRLKLIVAIAAASLPSAGV